MPLFWCFLSLRFIGWALDFRWSWTFHCHLLSAFWAVVRIYNCLLLLHEEAFRWDVRAILIYETVRKEFQCFEVRQRHCNPIQVFIVTAEHCACTLLFTWAWKALFFLLHLGPNSVKCIAVTCAMYFSPLMLCFNWDIAPVLPHRPAILYFVTDISAFPQNVLMWWQGMSI